MMGPQQVKEALGDVFHAVFGGFMGMHRIQVETIPTVLEGRGVLLSAPTASGKTEAVLAPLLRRALDRPALRPYAIWMCPTRALVNDLYERIAGSFRRLDVGLAVRTGERKQGLDRRAAALVTTPESLDVMLSSRDLAEKLRPVEMVVVDESHLLFGSRRGLQVLMLLQRLEKVHGAPVLRAGLSATVGDSDAAAEWLAGDGEPLRVIRGDQQREVNMRILGSYPDALTSVVGAAHRGIREEGWRKILVFTNTRNEADLVAETLTSGVPGYPVYLHFSSLPKDHREQVEQRFKESDRGICVATSTLELGVDIGDIDAAYMYGAPGSVSSFLQRAGRSNRRTNRTHVIAISRTHDPQRSERHDLWIRDVLTFAAMDLAVRDGILEQPHAPRYWSVVVQQAFSLARFFGRVGVTPIAAAAGTRVAPFVAEGGCRQLLAWLERLGYLAHQSYGDYYTLTDRGWAWLDSLQIWSNFSDQSESVAIMQGGEVLDQVAWANRFLLAPGSLVRVKGKTREVTAVTAQGIEVGPPTRSGIPLPLQRLGKGWPVSFEVAQALAALTHARERVIDDVEPILRPWFEAWLGRFQAIDLESEIPVELGSGPTYRTFLGGLGNQLAAALLAASGESARPDDLGLEGPSPDALQSRNLADAGSRIVDLAGELASQVPTTVHFSMLPDALKGDEVVSILSDPRVIARIQSLPRMNVVSVSAPPALPW